MVTVTPPGVVDMSFDDSVTGVLLVVDEVVLVDEVSLEMEVLVCQSLVLLHLAGEVSLLSLQASW